MVTNGLLRSNPINRETNLTRMAGRKGHTAFIADLNQSKWQITLFFHTHVEIRELSHERLQEFVTLFEANLEDLRAYCDLVNFCEE